jgi:hypothetical protein
VVLLSRLGEHRRRPIPTCGLPRKHKAPAEPEAKCLKNLVGRVGIEPTTNGLRV